MDYLQELLHINFPGVSITCSDPFTATVNSRLDSLSIEEIPDVVTRKISSEAFKQIALVEFSFGASATCEDIKRMVQRAVAATTLQLQELLGL